MEEIWRKPQIRFSSMKEEAPPAKQKSVTLFRIPANPVRQVAPDWGHQIGRGQDAGINCDSTERFVGDLNRLIGVIAKTPFKADLSAVIRGVKVALEKLTSTLKDYQEVFRRSLTPGEKWPSQGQWIEVTQRLASAVRDLFAWLTRLRQFI